MSADLFTLAERRIVVTGAGRGLGRGLATGIAKQGAHVVLVACSLPELGGTARKIREAGGSCRIVPADLANPGELDGLVTDLLAWPTWKARVDPARWPECADHRHRLRPPAHARI